MPITTVVAAILERSDPKRTILICRRHAKGAHPLKWEFPGGKVEPGESPEDALRRELREELAIEADGLRELTRYEYAYPGKNPILLIFFRVTSWTGDLNNLVFDQIVWEDSAHLKEYDFLEGDRPLFESGLFESEF